ncbi:MAG: NADH-quinone oxidoreductase subunit NuoE [Planctomycetota bacterium]
MARTFSDEALKELKEEILPGYPDTQSALLTTLWLAEREFGVIDTDAIAAVAEALDLPKAHVWGVFSFYTLFRKEGQGRYILDVCATLSCALRGARDIVHHLEEKLGIKAGETTPDGMFTLRKVECLADCDRAPMMQVNACDLHRNLTNEKVDDLLERLRKDAEATATN